MNDDVTASISTPIVESIIAIDASIITGNIQGGMDVLHHSSILCSKSSRKYGNNTENSQKFAGISHFMLEFCSIVMAQNTKYCRKFQVMWVLIRKPITFFDTYHMDNNFSLHEWSNNTQLTA